MSVLATLSSLFDPSSSRNSDGYRAQRSGQGRYTRPLRRRTYRRMRRRLAKQGRRAAKGNP